MPTATIEVKYHNRPAESKYNKDWGSVKTKDGTIYGYWKTMESQYEAGGVYEIFYEEKESKGKTYYTIKTAKPSSTTAGAAGAVLSQAQSGVVSSPRPDPQSENIFVAGAVNHAIGVGQIDISTMRKGELAGIIAYLREEYRDGSMAKPNGVAKSVGQQPDAEMADEIPF